MLMVLVAGVYYGRDPIDLVVSQVKKWIVVKVLLPGTLGVVAYHCQVRPTSDAVGEGGCCLQLQGYYRW